MTSSEMNPTLVSDTSGNSYFETNISMSLRLELHIGITFMIPLA